MELSAVSISRRWAALLLLSLQVAAFLPSTAGWGMKAVNSVHGRVIGQPPSFTAGKGWSLQYPLSSVNSASLEGVLKFVHTECIDWTEVKDQCQRKNGANYVVLFNLTFAQPNGSLAYYADPNVMNGEFGAYATFDGGQCHAQKECYEYYGKSDNTIQVPALGPYVGAKPDDTDVRAPYPGGWWYSLPGECPTEPWATKTKACVSAQPGGRCPDGVVPDGVTCTWSYTILGYVNIDDLVGITSQINPQTGQRFSNYTEWCKADYGNHVEFDRDPTTYDMIRGLSFWEDPKNGTANYQRYLKLMSVYHNGTLYPNNIPVPSSQSLRGENPKCHQSLTNCQPARGGCYRDNRMTCRSCTVSKDDSIPCESGADYVALPSLSVPTAAPIPVPNTAASPLTSPTAGTKSQQTTTTSGPTTSSSSKSNANALNSDGAATPTDGGGGGLGTLDVILIVLGSAIAAVLVVVAATWFYFVRERKKREGAAEPLLDQSQVEL